LILVTFSARSFGQAQQKDFSFNAPVDTLPMTRLSVWCTQYFIHRFKSEGKIPIRLADGSPTGLFADTCDFCKASLEGTAYVTDSAGRMTVINAAKTGTQMWVDCRKCTTYAKSKLNVDSWGKRLWVVSKGFGDGVAGYKLVPFRTIAVNKNRIPYGTVLFIPKARGKTIILPDGSKVKHDGFFFAGDTGSEIKDNHIDVFTGLFEGNPFPEVITSSEGKTITAYIIKDPAIISTLTSLHKK